MRKLAILPAALIAVLTYHVYQAKALAQNSAAAVKVNPLRNAFYGDLHLHTSYSFDAYLAGTTGVDPDAAYRFARGEVVNYLGQRVQRSEPLDFLAVTDHSENIGVLSRLEDPNSPVSRADFGKAARSFLASITGPDGRRDWMRLFKAPGLLDKNYNWTWDYFLGRQNKLPDSLRPESRAAWAREIDFANRNYEPGTFTTFVAYEWTATPYGANLHRNVIFKGNSAPYPFTSFDSKNPQDLWDWLEAIRKQGFEALAIPHNGNASNGLMYDWVDGSSMPIDRAYAEERQANEPLSEIAQSKGASETHPLLSPYDEFADYEIYDQYAKLRQHEGRPEGSYLRDALGRGLVLQRQLGVNPYLYGFVGGSDQHSGLSVSAQADYGGREFEVNMGGGRPSKAEAASVLSGSAPVGSLKTTSGNLTGVWAESNTRDSIYNALRRRETFATSGTKLRFRLFGGWTFGEALLQEKDWIATAYARGVPMGGNLPAKPATTGAPSFAMWAVKDPNSGNLDRLQIIKVWEEEGKQREKIFDVAWSNARKPAPKTGNLPAVADPVDLKTGHFSNNIGVTELKAVWKDSEFNPQRLAAYYLRVLEVPTPRWSTLLAIKSGLPLPKNVPPTIQERGWSSPIWYTPHVNSKKLN